jgi:hypothetical protein
VFVGELLEEVAPALEDAQTAVDTGFEPERIIGRRAVLRVLRGVNKPNKWLEGFPRATLGWDFRRRARSKIVRRVAESYPTSDFEFSYVISRFSFPH